MSTPVIKMWRTKFGITALQIVVWIFIDSTYDLWSNLFGTTENTESTFGAKMLLAVVSLDL